MPEGCQRNRSRTYPPRSRRGAVLIYAMFLMIIMLAMVSLAVDYGHVQLVETQLQRDADASARGTLQIYCATDQSNAIYWGGQMATNTYNPVDANSGISDTITLTWGYWTPSNKTFSTTSGTMTAVKVVASRTAANGNAVPLVFPLLAGLALVHESCDVSATSIAMLTPATTATVTVPGTSDLWLAEMPHGSTASDNDTAPAQSPPLAMNVTAGAAITFTDISGSVSHYSGGSNDPASGEPSYVIDHNFDTPDGEPAVQNKIGDIYSPMDSLLGVFLTSSAPNTRTAPTVVRNYSTSAAENANNYTDIQLQQPFYIGTGQTSGRVTQTFLVPQGATELYLGTMDGHQWANNGGSFTVTVTQQPIIQLVQ
jgi:Flp pilus assembly protein TadG